MIVRGKLVSWPSSERRAEPRRIVNLAPRVRDRRSTVVDVCAADISTEGCRVTPAGSAEAGNVVWLKLPGLEVQRCHVVWVEDQDAGCRFDLPLHAAELDQLRKQALPRPSRGRFGRKA